MGYLWEGGRFQIVGSQVGTSNGGDAELYVESKILRLRFSCDRRELLLDFRPVGEGGRWDWYSVDIVYSLFRSDRDFLGLLDESYASFLGEFLPQIEAKFAVDRWNATRSELKRLEAARSRKLFG